MENQKTPLWVRVAIVLLFLVLVGGLIVIVFFPPKEVKERATIVVDYKRCGWQLADGDSVWWSMAEFIVDKPSTDSTFGVIHMKDQDTIWGLKNFKPLVVIKDADTSRYWFGDTIRFQSCIQK